MHLSFFHVGAFTSRAFSGKPAAVCPLNAWLDDRLLRLVAAETIFLRLHFSCRDAISMNCAGSRLVVSKALRTRHTGFCLCHRANSCSKSGFGSLRDTVQRDRFDPLFAGSLLRRSQLERTKNARQLSERGGEIRCEAGTKRFVLKGNACLRLRVTCGIDEEILPGPLVRN
jgi:Phenazine biosynthesis-like protein